ncbi:hypothetical protein CBL_05151 [Carabus blaptoides fortunei]
MASHSGTAMDADGFQLVQPRHNRKRPPSVLSGDYHSASDNDIAHKKRQSDSPTRSTSSLSNSYYTQRKQLYTVVISNLPTQLRTPKSLSTYLHHVSGVEIVNVISTRNGNILIKSTDNRAAIKLQVLKQIIGNNDIRIEPEDQRQTQSNHQPPRQPSFSCVIKGVDLDVTKEDIQQHLVQQDLPFKAVWRIRSRLTNKDTRLVRVVTTNQHTLDDLLSHGITIFYRHHWVEPSHAPKPQPLQCMRCQRFHEPGECRQQPRCSHCAKPHNIRQCDVKANPAKCANCTEDHPASSYKCPVRPKEPINAAATAPLKCVDVPSDDSEIVPANTYDMLRFITAVTLNTVPDQRARMQSVLSDLAALHPTTNIATVNICCLGRKKPLIVNLLKSDNIQILGRTDTRASSRTVIRYPSFLTYRRDRDPDTHGGVAILAHHSIATKELKIPAEFHDINVCAITAETKHGPVHIFCLYTRPSASFPSALFEYVSNLGSAIIMGDFNARHRSFGDHASNTLGITLDHLLTTLPLFRIEHNEPTFINANGHSIIDHIVITETLISQFNDSAFTGTSVASDHLPTPTKQTGSLSDYTSRPPLQHTRSLNPPMTLTLQLPLSLPRSKLPLQLQFPPKSSIRTVSPFHNESSHSSNTRGKYTESSPELTTLEQKPRGTA